MKLLFVCLVNLHHTNSTRKHTLLYSLEGSVFSTLEHQTRNESLHAKYFKDTSDIQNLLLTLFRQMPLYIQKYKCVFIFREENKTVISQPCWYEQKCWRIVHQAEMLQVTSHELALPLTDLGKSETFFCPHQWLLPP